MDSANFAERVYLVLSELNISKKAFSESLGLSHSAVSSWKATNTFPSVEVLFSVAEKLEVSIDWLLNGESSLYVMVESTHSERARTEVRKRIYQSVCSKYPEDTICQKVDFTDEAALEEIHKAYFKDGFISYRRLFNWAKGRCEIDYILFEQIADNFGANILYLLVDSAKDLPSDFEPQLFALAKTFRNQLYCLHNFSPERLQQTETYISDQWSLQAYENKDQKTE